MLFYKIILLTARCTIQKNIDKIKKTIAYELPEYLKRIRDLIIWLDDKICHNSKKCIGIMVVFEK